MAVAGEEPAAHELWTLNRLAGLPYRFDVVTVARAADPPVIARAARSLHHFGFRRALARLGGSVIRGCGERRHLDSLFDTRYLRWWWRTSGIGRIPISTADGAREAILGLKPDILIQVCDELPVGEMSSLARIATLRIHPGTAPPARDPWTVRRGIIEGRGDGIGATVRRIDGTTESGAVLWRGAPQVACGDTAVTLLFRAHLQAVDALVDLIREYAAGKTVSAALG